MYEKSLNIIGITCLLIVPLLSFHISVLQFGFRSLMLFFTFSFMLFSLEQYLFFILHPTSVYLKTYYYKPIFSSFFPCYSIFVISQMSYLLSYLSSFVFFTGLVNNSFLYFTFLI